MSADNGIYILKTKDQYRVTHVQNAEYMTCSAIERKRGCGALVPTRAVELWGNCKYTRRWALAYHIAHKWAGSLPVCEYGVNVIYYNKKWDQLVKEAKTYEKKEIRAIRDREDEKYWNMEYLRKLAGM